MGNHSINLPVFDRDSPHPEWIFIEGKTGGANKAGPLGGKYRIKSSKKMLYLKKDPIQEKNICEVFASQFMRFIAEEIGLDPNLIANMDYVNTDAAKDGSDIYICSELFGDYCDLYLDSHLALQLPIYEDLRPTIGKNWNILPKKRPNYFQSDPCIKLMLDSGRYQNIIPGIALRTIIDDPDLHFENIGITPKTIQQNSKIKIPLFENGRYVGKVLTKTPPSPKAKIELIHGYYAKEELIDDFDNFEQICIKYGDKYYFVPNVNNTQTVQIDFGGALGDFRLAKQRKFDGRIHTNKFSNFFRYHFSPHTPPAYQDRLPFDLNSSHDFFNTLVGFSQIDEGKIKAKVIHEIDRVFNIYQKEPEIFQKFALRIGVEFSSKADYELIKQETKNFLTKCFSERQVHAKKLCLNFICSHDQHGFDLLMGKESSLQNKNNYFTKFLTEQKDAPLIKLLTEINDLKIQPKPNYNPEFLNHYLKNLKSSLHKEVTAAFLSGSLERQKEHYSRIIAESSALILKFDESYLEISKTKSSKEKAAILAKFIKEAKSFEKRVIKHATLKRCITAASEFVGALVGGLIGAAIGLALGATLGIIKALPSPHKFFSLKSGLLAVVKMVKDIGFNLVTTTAACTVLVGGSSASGLSYSLNYLISPKYELETKKLLKNLPKQLDKIEGTVVEVKKEEGLSFE